MLGDSGSNALGAMLGLSSVDRFTGKGRWIAIASLAALTVLGERRSLGRMMESTPVLRELDALGRSARVKYVFITGGSSRRSARASSPPRSAGC